RRELAVVGHPHGQAQEHGELVLARRRVCEHQGRAGATGRKEGEGLGRRPRSHRGAELGGGGKLYGQDGALTRWTLRRRPVDRVAGRSSGRVESMSQKPEWLQLKGKPWRSLAQRPIYDNPWIGVTEHDAVAPTGSPANYGVVSFKNFAIAILPL